MVIRRRSNPTSPLIFRLDFHGSFRTLRLASRLPSRTLWFLLETEMKTFGDLLVQIKEDFGIRNVGVGLYDRGGTFICPAIDIGTFVSSNPDQIEPIIVRPYVQTYWQNMVVKLWDLLEALSMITISEGLTAIAYILFIMVSLWFILSF